VTSAMDPAMFNMLIGAVLVVGPSTIAWAAGRRSGRTAERRVANTAELLVCSCEHGFGTHDNGGACSGTSKRLLSSHNYGQSQDWEWVPCRCHSYDGPEPLPRVWTAFPQLPAALPLDDVRRIG
jgi:hypothetical protein